MARGQSQPGSAPSGGNLLTLLVVLAFALMITPLFERWFMGRSLIYAATTAVLLAAVVTTRRRRYSVFFASGFIAILAIAVMWSTLLVDHRWLFVSSCVLESVFYAAVACLLGVTVLKKHLGTVHSIFGVICVYLLLGLAWAQLYWATERLDHESLSISQRDHTRTTLRVAMENGPDPRPEALASVAPFSQMVYFSFVTMSTLGYGDIVPETPVARTLTWMQSVLGQFYLAVLVGWVVSEVPRPRRQGKRRHSAPRPDG